MTTLINEIRYGPRAQADWSKDVPDIDFGFYRSDAATTNIKNCDSAHVLASTTSVGVWIHGYC